MYGEAMARARKRAGLSQRQAAAMVGISQAYVAGLEIGSNDPELLRTLVRMAEIYGTDISTMLGMGRNAGNDVLSRLSPQRHNEIMEIAQLFLLMDSQEYRSEVMEGLIAGGVFGGNSVLNFLLAARDGRVEIGNDLIANGARGTD